MRYRYNGTSALYFVYTGKGSLDFIDFMFIRG